MSEPSARGPFSRSALLLAASLEPTAVALQRVGQKLGLSAVNERDQLQPCFPAALRERIAEADADVLTGEPPVSNDWLRLGPVDVALVWAEGETAFIELKAGADVNALGRYRAGASERDDFRKAASVRNASGWSPLARAA
jgi:hypothetical protein